MTEEIDKSWMGQAVEPRDWDRSELISKPGNMVWNTSLLDWVRMRQPTTPSETQPVSVETGGTVYSGTQTVTNAAAPLATQACKRVVVRANTDNDLPIYIGGSGTIVGTGYPLWPGDKEEFIINNVNVLYVLSAGNTGEIINWIATE